MNVSGAKAGPELVEPGQGPSQSYKEALAWLYGLQRFGIKLGLENIERLIAELSRKGHLPWRAVAQRRRQIAHSPAAAGEAAAPWKVIHVAGTNGKGSVCAMIEAISRAHGYRTGLFTSPHLVTFRERIRINSEMISQSAAASGLTTIRDLVAQWDPHPTFFEVATALALKHFSEAKIDIMILETGLGGRLDATNAIQSDVAVITPVDLDHQKWLGESFEEIAGEKAGIIKSRIPVVSAAQKKETEAILRKRAAECKAPIQFVNESYNQTPITLRGAHQKQNAAVAIAALRAAKIDINDAAIARGLLSVDWPARFQQWDDRTIIDGAHNPGAACVLAQTWREIFGGQRATLILGVLSDKDLRGISEALAPISSYVFLPGIRSERAALPEEIAQTLSTVAPSLPYSITASIADALDQARAKPDPILLTGSLHFAGEALAHLRGEPGAFEECAQ